MNSIEEHDFVSVFRGTRAGSLEFGLVLEAKGIPYQSIALEHEWILAVTSDLAAQARDELERYAEERVVKRERAPSIVPFDGAGLGAIGYAFVLLVVAYCAGANLFTADWFSIGAVDASRPENQQWWRAFTALSLHAGPEHLFGNLFFGIVAGGLCSRLLGPGVAWMSILLAAAGANLLEQWIAPIGHRAVGASTAVFAALGLLAGYAWRQRLSLRERWLYRWAPLIAGASLLSLLGAGEGTEHVDVLGHLLGFLAGLGCGWVYAVAGMPRSRSVGLQIGAGALAVGLLSGAWALALCFGRS
jgi:membrane associated rhomboid family serine protease